MKTLKIASVRYMNTFPFIFGLEQSKLFGEMEILLDTPSRCKELFETGVADVALIPVAGLHFLQEYRQFSDFCIGCQGKVKTVALFSNQRIDDIRKIYLDQDSLTSVELVKYLVNNYWNREVDYKVCNVRTVNVKTGEAVLMIGDKAFDSYEVFSVSYDLGEVWQEATKLPFVFAVWIAKKNVSPEILDQLNQDFRFGISHIDEVVNKYQPGFPENNLTEYYRNFISYGLDKRKKEAQKYFLDYLAQTKMSIGLNA